MSGHEETMAASRALDRMLEKAATEIKGMPGPGAGKSVREILASANAEVASALTEFAQMVSDKKKAMAADIRANGALVVKKMSDDHDEAMTAFGDMLGNERAGDEGK